MSKGNRIKEQKRKPIILNDPKVDPRKVKQIKPTPVAEGVQKAIYFRG